MSALALAQRLLFSIEDELSGIGDNTLNNIENHLIESLARVRRRRNDRQTVNKLPPELLVMIFSHVVEPYFVGEPVEFTIWGSNMMDIEDLVPVSQVCHYWRKLALGTPQLWNSIEHTCEHSVDALLARARSLQLRVFLSGTPHGGVNTLFRAHGPQIEELFWEEFQMHENEGLYLYLALPRLRTLAIMSTPSSSHGLVSPPTFFHQPGQPCSISRLSLSGLDWLPTSSFESLTHLHLANLSYENVLSDTVAMLSRCLQLTDLVFSDCSFHPGTATRAALPNLQRLVFLQAFSEEIVPLLSCLQLGAATAVRMCMPNVLNRFNPATAGVFKELPAMRSPTRVQINIYGENSASLSVINEVTGVYMQAAEEVEVTNLVLSICDSMAAGFTRELWLNTLPDAVTRCVGSLGHSYMRHALLHLLLAMPALETLVVSGRNLAVVLNALQTSHNYLTGQRNLCPQLKGLHVLFDARSPDAADLLDPLATDFAALELHHIRVAYLPTYHRTRMYGHHTLDAHVPCVEYIDLSEHPKMPVPPVCREGAHCYWKDFECDAKA